MVAWKEISFDKLAEWQGRHVVAAHLLYYHRHVVSHESGSRFQKKTVAFVCQLTPLNLIESHIVLGLMQY